jgi:hypothetical protein
MIKLAPFDLGGLLPSNTTTTGSASSSGTSTQQRTISQEGINKLIYDALSADSGTAALATGENLSGGYAASTKALLSQDFMVKLIGELANVTAPVTTTTEQQQQSSGSSKKKLTVICTELNRQGLLSDDLYDHPAALAHFNSLPVETIAGYRIWADKVVPLMQSSPALCRAILPIAVARYEMITTGKFSVLGWLTIVPAQAACYAIGKFLTAATVKEYGNGYISS